MGYRVLLIAVTGKSVDAIHEDYGVTPTDEYEDVPESPVTGTTLPNGAYLLYVNDKIVPEDQVLARLFRGASLVACHANEAVMISLTSSWVDGVARWWLFHDVRQGIDHLDSGGEVPGGLKPILDEQLTKQVESTDVDYVFDVPVELFVAHGGIRYDRRPRGLSWQVLRRC